MLKIREDNTYNDIREKSLMQWLNQVREEGSYIDACGAKLAMEYIAHLEANHLYRSCFYCSYLCCSHFYCSCL